jgi:geranylgeranyl transferase type-2 subunit beta
MALVSGPGRGDGLSAGGVPHELELVIDKHVEYIRKLDTVRALVSNGCAFLMTFIAER